MQIMAVVFSAVLYFTFLALRPKLNEKYDMKDSTKNQTIKTEIINKIGYSFFIFLC